MKLLRFSSLAFRPSMRTFGARIAAAEERDCALTSCRIGGALSFYRMFSTTLLWRASPRGVLLPAVLCGACVFSLSACSRCTLPVDAVQWFSVRGNETERGSLVILIPNTLFVVTFAVLAVMAVLMLRRGVVAEAVCATVAAVGCVLPLVAIGLAPAAREGNMVAAAVVVAAYILTYVFTLGGAAGMFVFSRARVQSALAELEGEGE